MAEKLYCNDSDFEQTVLEWFDEVEEETSVNDKMLDPDFALLSDHESPDKQSVGENENNQERIYSK